MPWGAKTSGKVSLARIKTGFLADVLGLAEKVPHPATVAGFSSDWRVSGRQRGGRTLHHVFGRIEAPTVDADAHRSPARERSALAEPRGRACARGGDHPTGLTIEVLSPSVSRLRALALLYAFVFFMVAVFPVLSSRPDRASLSGSSMSSPLSCQVLSLEDLCH